MVRGSNHDPGAAREDHVVVPSTLLLGRLASWFSARSAMPEPDDEIERVRRELYSEIRGRLSDSRWTLLRQALLRAPTYVWVCLVIVAGLVAATILGKAGAPSLVSYLVIVAAFLYAPFAIRLVRGKHAESRKPRRKGKAKPRVAGKGPRQTRTTPDDE